MELPVWSLHLGFVWVPVGLLSTGLSAFLPGVPQAAGLHALTAGAMGGMTLAVMTRATLGHTGRLLTADRWTAAIYLLVATAAALRATAPCGPRLTSFLAYDRNDQLVSTIYMIPLADIEAQKKFDDLAVRAENVVDVDMYYNAGHPGVEQPHSHVVLGMFPRAIPSSNSQLTRCAALRAGGLLLAGLAAPVVVRPVRGGDVVEILPRSDALGTKVWFDPIGVLIEPGQTVHWVNEANVHTSTAYHPDNDGHALRTPEAAESWDSGYLVEPGDQFEVTLTVEGVYDYFCTPSSRSSAAARRARAACTRAAISAWQRCGPRASAG
jgi:plastocyanin